MRETFVDTVTELAHADPRVWLVTGDLGFHLLEDFEKELSDQYLNAGVAEQNMTGLSAGLALSGKVVFTYSIVNFATLRCLEQIRNDICYHDLNVNIVTVGGGFPYGSQGYTHHGVEDMGCLRLLPNMTVVAPGDPVEAELATRHVAEEDSPSYLRFRKVGEPVIHEEPPDFTVGEALTVRSGDDITIIASGAALATAVEAADRLHDAGVRARVLSMHTITPLDGDAIRRAAQETNGIVTIEQHGLGGLGTAVSEVLAQTSTDVPFHAHRIGKRPAKTADGEQTLLREHGLTPEALVESAKRCLKGDPAPVGETP